MKKSQIIQAVAALSLFAATPALAVETGNSNLKIGAKIFADYTQSKTTLNGATTAKTTGMNIGRAYLQTSYKIDDMWSLGVTLDAAQENTLSKKTSVFVKNAYVKGSFSPMVEVSLGIITTPWIAYEDGLSKHRYVAKSYADTMGFDSSADAGIGVSGQASILHYALAGVNGAGYGNIAASNGQDFNGRIGLAAEGATFDVGYRNGFKGTNTLGTGVVTATSSGTKSALTQIMATYGENDYRVGANYIMNNDKVVATNLQTKSRGVETWVWANATDVLGVFGRYESTKAKSDANVGTTQTTKHYVLGLESRYGKNVTMALALDQTNVTNNGYTVGSTKKTTKFGLYTQAKF
ncbi:MAG: hypothetical protein HQM07_01095 [Zetaproteobacteria bacterium]|nr:hypothetical protein [Zetaproteobacteria bacterium]